MQHEGLFGKYLLRKADGTPLAPEAKYFVVRYDAGAEHGHAGRMALVRYARAVEEDCPGLARDLLQSLLDESGEAFANLREGGDPNAAA